MVHFVTGYPGFIGRRLVRALLERDETARVVALVQSSMLESARKLAGERVEVIEGDITDRRLGLQDDDYDRVAGEVGMVWHLAAVYDLAVPAEIAQRVNVDGTGNVLDFCLAARDLKRLAYFSTAYVAGTRTGVVYEHELVMGQGFKNHYESTKFQAEVWVRDELHRIPTTILRPAIVVGDSQTGETEKFDGPYFILRTISNAQKLHHPILRFGRSAAKFNVVPVDYVVAASVAAAYDAHTVGQTLHLVDPEPLSSGELFDVLAREYAGRTPRARVPAKLVQGTLRSRKMREMFGGAPRESIAYLNHPVVYDTRRTVDFLRPHGLVPPRFPDYAPAMVRFFAQHEDDPDFQPRI